jgi:hypothetical protein
LPIWGRTFRVVRSEDHSGLTARELGLGWGKSAAPDAYAHFTATRLHFRYDRDHFPEDLALQETADIQPFTVAYSVHHQAENVGCEAGQKYLASLGPRREQEAQALAVLTGWDAREIREKMGVPLRPAALPADPRPWWQVWE